MLRILPVAACDRFSRRAQSTKFRQKSDRNAANYGAEPFPMTPEIDIIEGCFEPL